MSDVYYSAEAEGMARRLGVLDREGLGEQKPISPLIEDTIDRQTLTLLAGPWGTAKTFVGLGMALSVTTGHPWLGRHVMWGGMYSRAMCLLEDELIEDVHYIVEDGERQIGDWFETPGGVKFEFAVVDDKPFTTALYVCAEGAQGITSRVAAWETATGLTASGLLVLPQPVDLLDHRRVRQIVDFVVETDVDLVVFDTLSRCMPGGDENSAKDMSTAVAHLDEIKDATDGGTVLVIHHTGKDGKTVRGSSVLEAAADVVYQVESDPGGFKLRRTKRKDGPTPDQLLLRLRPVGESCVVEPASGVVELEEAEQVVLEVAKDLCMDGPVLRTQLRDTAVEATDRSRATVYRAIKMLVEAGHLRETGSGRASLVDVSEAMRRAVRRPPADNGSSQVVS